MTGRPWDEASSIGDPLMEVALEAARLLGVALHSMRGEPEPGFANKVEHTIRRIYEIDAARVHGG
jgi:hypothetical protein